MALLLVTPSHVISHPFAQLDFLHSPSEPAQVVEEKSMSFLHELLPKLCTLLHLTKSSPLGFLPDISCQKSGHPATLGGHLASFDLDDIITPKNIRDIIKTTTATINNVFLKSGIYKITNIFLYKMNIMSMEKQQYNGRINVMGGAETLSLHFQDKIPNNSSSFHEAMNGTYYDTTLSKTFFSLENQTIIQNGIRAGVYKMSNNTYIVGYQDDDSLKTIMRSIFLQNSTNLPNDIKGQIKHLNEIVLNYSIPQVYGEAQGYIKYKEDISTLPNPIARPVMSKPNNKQLEQKPWF